MVRCLMAWELGGGLGHAGRLKVLAEHLLAQGHEVAFALRDIVHAGAMLKGLDVPVMQAPVWMHKTVGLPQPTISLTEILLGNGYLQADNLDALVRGWRAVMNTWKATVVVADYAPSAVIAAHTLGLPCATVGNAFYMPPDVRPLPPFMPGPGASTSRVQHHEHRTLASINAVLTQHGATPWTGVAQALRGDLPLLCAWPEIDPYTAQRRTQPDPYLGPSCLPSPGVAPCWPEGQGPRAFAYLRTQHPEVPAVLQALVARGCRTLCYLPEVAAGQPAPLQHPLLAYAPGPVDLAQALPACDLVVAHGGESTLAQALLAGKPVLLLPLQAEQFLTAQSIEASGLGLNAGTRARPCPYPDLLAELLRPGAWNQALRALQARHAEFCPEAQVEALSSAILQLSERPSGDARQPRPGPSSP